MSDVEEDTVRKRIKRKTGSECQGVVLRTEPLGLVEAGTPLAEDKSVSTLCFLNPFEQRSTKHHQGWKTGVQTLTIRAARISAGNGGAEGHKASWQQQPQVITAVVECA